MIDEVNDAKGTRYRGAVLVTDIRPNSRASAAGIQRGDLLLGIDSWQTIDREDVKLIARKFKQLGSKGKARFYVVRNHQILFGYVDVSEQQKRSIQADEAE